MIRLDIPRPCPPPIRGSSRGCLLVVLSIPERNPLNDLKFESHASRVYLYGMGASPGNARSREKSRSTGTHLRTVLRSGCGQRESDYLARVDVHLRRRPVRERNEL